MGEGRGGRNLDQNVGEEGEELARAASLGLLTQMVPSLVLPRNAHAHCCSLCHQLPPPTAVRSAAAVEWFPHPCGLLAKYRNNSVSGKGAAGRLSRVLLRPGALRVGGEEIGSLPHPIGFSPTFRPRQAQKGLKGS